MQGEVTHDTCLCEDSGYWRLRAENAERMLVHDKQLRENSRRLTEAQERIDKALKAAPKDPDRVHLCNLPGYIRAMVKALKGET